MRRRLRGWRGGAETALRRGGAAVLLAGGVTDGFPETQRGADQDLLRNAVPAVLLEQLCVHAGEGVRLLHLEEPHLT